MLFNLTYEQALEKADHLIALDDTVIHLDGDDFPWVAVESVEKGSGFRLNGPTGCYVIARVAGLTFKKSIEFEGRDANGKGVTVLDRDAMRDLARKLPYGARLSFVKMLREDVLPTVEKRTADIREALNTQSDSEDCIRGLIAFAESQ